LRCQLIRAHDIFTLADIKGFYLLHSRVHTLFSFDLLLSCSESEHSLLLWPNPLAFLPLLPLGSIPSSASMDLKDLPLSDGNTNTLFIRSFFFFFIFFRVGFQVHEHCNRPSSALFRRLLPHAKAMLHCTRFKRPLNASLGHIPSNFLAVRIAMPLKRLSKFKPSWVASSMTTGLTNCSRFLVFVCSSPVSSDHVREDLVDEESRFVTIILRSTHIDWVFCNAFSGRKRSVSAASDGSEVLVDLFFRFNLLIVRYLQRDLPDLAE